MAGATRCRSASAPPRETGRRAGFFAATASEARPRRAAASLLLLLASCCRVPSATGVASTSTSPPPPPDYERAARAIREAIRTRTMADEDGKPFHFLVAAFVRLAFSGCVGERCDGCVARPKPRNGSLAVAVDVIEGVRRRDSASGGARLSRADLWAIAAVEAVNFGIARSNAVRGTSRRPARIALRLGRRDCASAPYREQSSPVRPPSPLMAVDGVLSFFRDKYKMGERAAVALMGAHTLGALRRQDDAAAFANWVRCADCFDGDYFRDLVDARLGWRQRSVRLDAASSNAVDVWRHGDGKRFMFNCDMSLVLNFSVADSGSGRATCSYERCPRSDTARWVRLYARDDGAWLADFEAAFERLIEHGYAPGELAPPQPPRPRNG